MTPPSISISTHTSSAGTSSGASSPGGAGGWGCWRSRAELTGRSPAGYRDGLWHALGMPHPTLGSYTRAPSTQSAGEPGVGEAGTAGRTTLCSTVVEVARRRSVFDPDRYPGHMCPACVWWEAIGADTLAAQVARLAGAPARGLAVAVTEAVLAAACVEGELASRAQTDWVDTVELLAAVTEHAGQALIAADGAEGACAHADSPQGCPVVVVACPTCSIISADGCYRPEAIVAVPCSLLSTMAGYFQIGAGLLEDAVLPGTLHTAPPGEHTGSDTDGDGVDGDGADGGGADVPIGYALTEHAYAAGLLDDRGYATRWRDAPPTCPEPAPITAAARASMPAGPDDVGEGS